MLGHLFWLLPLVAVLVGALFVAGGLRTLRTDRRRRTSWLSYPGRVVGSRSVSSGLSDDLTDQTQCQVAHVRDGREIVFWNRFTSTRLRNPQGRAVEVLVNPDDAGDAVISRGVAGGRTVGAVVTAAGALFAAIGLAVGVTALLR